MSIRFDELNIKEFLKEGIKDLKIEATTPIQELTINPLLEGKDIIGQAKTGTGKTFAYGVPLLNSIDTNNDHIQGLVILPTRELATQVYNEFSKLIKYNPEIKLCLILGGESYERQFATLRKHPHIVVSTPGRTIDHMKRKTIDFSDISFLVLDEGDEMLKMGFQEELEVILRDTPDTRTTALFSATIPDFIKEAASKYQKDPLFLKVESDTLTASKIKQCYYFIRKQDRTAALMKILDFHTCSSAIIFCNTKNDVNEVNDVLNKCGYSALALHGDLRQKEREHVLGNFRKKQIKYLIATDVAARGLDISHVDLVINYDLPYENELYVHRIGRTGRVNNSGLSISLVYPSSKNKLWGIQRFTNVEMELLTIPSDDAVNNKRFESVVDEYLTSVKDNNEGYVHPIIQQLLDSGLTELELLNYIFDKKYKNKKYDAVEVIEILGSNGKKKSRDRGNSRTERDTFKGNKTPRVKGDTVVASKRYVVAIINLGKKDNVKPVKFLDFLRKQCDIHSKAVGDIIINDKDMKFEIDRRDTAKLEKLKGKKYLHKEIHLVVVDK